MAFFHFTFFLLRLLGFVMYLMNHPITVTTTPYCCFFYVSTSNQFSDVVIYIRRVHKRSFCVYKIDSMYLEFRKI